MQHILIIFSLFTLISCKNPMSILGPTDKPNIASNKWNQIQVTYWTNTTKSNVGIEKVFTILDAPTIEKLKLTLTPVETSGLSIGTDRQLLFKTRTNETWHGGFVFPNTLYLSLSADAGRSYKFVLEGNNFYDQIRQLCALNEATVHPNAKAEHINLLTNFEMNYPKLDKPIKKQNETQ